MRLAAGKNKSTAFTRSDFNSQKLPNRRPRRGASVTTMTTMTRHFPMSTSPILTSCVRASSTPGTSASVTARTRSSLRRGTTRWPSCRRWLLRTSIAASRSSVTWSPSVKGSSVQTSSRSAPTPSTARSSSFPFCRQNRRALCSKSKS